MGEQNKIIIYSNKYNMFILNIIISLFILIYFRTVTKRYKGNFVSICKFKIFRTDKSLNTTQITIGLYIYRWWKMISIFHWVLLSKGLLWKVKNFSAGQEIPCFYRICTFFTTFTRVTNTPTLSQFNLDPTFKPYIHCYINLPFAPMFPAWIRP
jgi:hypothetical protein